MIKILLVGGVWDTNGGRASGYIDKVFAEIISKDNIGGAMRNGGNIHQLVKLDLSADGWDVVIWFADIDNSEPKLLRNLIKANPSTLFVQSKNNKLGKYGD